MKKTKKVALGGILAALSLCVMLLAYFPYLTYALPALAGAFLLVAVQELGVKWAFSVYVAVAALSLLMCEKEAAVMFALIFGIYPVFKGMFDRLQPRLVRVLAKQAALNVAAVAAYWLVVSIFRIPMDDLGLIGQYGPWVLLVMFNIAFLPYDYCMTYVLLWYQIHLRKKVWKMLK